MSKHTTPDFKGPRSTGDHRTPDYRSPGSNAPRGKYPADNGGPSEFRVPRSRQQRGAADTPQVPANAQVARRAPRKPTPADNTRNPLK